MAIRFPVLDADGKVEAVGTFAVDITERKEAEAALQASEARLNAINAANPVPMNIARLSDRKLLFVNEPYIRLYGLEGVDLDSFDRDTLYPDPAERDWLYGELAAGREVTDHELTLRRTDGRRGAGVADLAADPVPGRAGDRDDLGRPDRAAGRPGRGGALARGAAPEREADRARGAARRRGARAQQPAVGGGRLFLDAAARSAATRRWRRGSEKIHAAAERCARIVRTFLAMARARPPQREPVALGEVVMGALDLAGYGLQERRRRRWSSTCRRACRRCTATPTSCTRWW